MIQEYRKKYSNEKEDLPIDEVAFPACHIIGIMQIGKELRPVGLGVTRLAIFFRGAITGAFAQPTSRTSLHIQPIRGVHKVRHAIFGSFQFGIVAGIGLFKKTRIGGWIARLKV